MPTLPGPTFNFVRRRFRIIFSTVKFARSRFQCNGAYSTCTIVCELHCARGSFSIALALPSGCRCLCVYFPTANWFSPFGWRGKNRKNDECRVRMLRRERRQRSSARKTAKAFKFHLDGKCSHERQLRGASTATLPFAVHFNSRYFRYMGIAVAKFIGSIRHSLFGVNIRCNSGPAAHAHDFLSIFMVSFRIDNFTIYIDHRCSHRKGERWIVNSRLRSTRVLVHVLNIIIWNANDGCMLSGGSHLPSKHFTYNIHCYGRTRMKSFSLIAWTGAATAITEYEPNG